ncbi:MAG: hypothetical protein ACJAZO_004188 [Myxococcota bacterium]|jgi:hypothetical protein
MRLRFAVIAGDFGPYTFARLVAVDVPPLVFQMGHRKPVELNVPPSHPAQGPRLVTVTGGWSLQGGP